MMKAWLDIGLLYRSAVIAGLALATACGDDDKPTTQPASDSGTPTGDSGTPTVDGGTQTGDSGTPGPDSGTPSVVDASLTDASTLPDAGTDSAVPAANAVYVVGMRVWAQDDSFMYLKLSRTLDAASVAFSPADYANALEIGAYAGVTVQDGYVLVGEEDMPFVTKYEITPDLKWKKVGEVLNFSTYFQGGDGLNDYMQAKKGNDQFFFYGSSGTARAHWKVSEWKIVGAYTDTMLPLPPTGWALGNQGNRTRVEGFKDAVVWPFVMAPEAEGVTGVPQSFLAVYDGTTFAEKAVIQPSCPDLAWSTKDEDGNLYFSPRDRSPVYALYGESAPNCVVKVKPDGTVDTTFGPNGEKTFTNLTGGLEGYHFKYLGKGKAAIIVMDKAGIQGANFDGPIQQNVLCQTVECEDTAELMALYNDKLFTHYVVDLATNTAKPFTGYTNEKHAFGNYRIFFVVDGRPVFMSYNDDDSLAMYELNPETAVVTPIGSGTFQAMSSGEYTVINRVR